MPEAAAVAGARKFLRRTLDNWDVDEETADTAVLCLSELVTNAVIHSHAGCLVRVRLDQGVLRTTVRDHGTAGAASEVLLEDPLRVHGRGLLVVEALAARWGYELDTEGTTFGFELRGLRALSTHTAVPGTESRPRHPHRLPRGVSP